MSQEYWEEPNSTTKILAGVVLVAVGLMTVAVYFHFKTNRATILQGSEIPTDYEELLSAYNNAVKQAENSELTAEERASWDVARKRLQDALYHFWEGVD